MASLKDIDWGLIEERDENGGGKNKLDPGAYVVVISDAYEGTAKSGKRYLGIVYDVAEGPCAGFYDTPFGRANEWAHEERFFYENEVGAGIMKGFLNRLEESNGSFTVQGWQQGGCRPRALAELQVGVVLRRRLYTYNGKDRDRLEACRWTSAETVRKGGIEPPADRDERENAPQDAGAPAQGGGYTDDEIPF